MRKREAEAGEAKGGARGEGIINTWMQSVSPGQPGARPRDLQNNWISNVERGRAWVRNMRKMRWCYFLFGPVWEMRLALCPIWVGCVRAVTVTPPGLGNTLGQVPADSRLNRPCTHTVPLGIVPGVETRKHFELASGAVVAASGQHLDSY